MSQKPGLITDRILPIDIPRNGDDFDFNYHTLILYKELVILFSNRKKSTRIERKMNKIERVLVKIGGILLD